MQAHQPAAPNKIGFLHTAEVHVDTFQRLLTETAPGIEARHIVDPDLLADARETGITPAIEQRVRQKLIAAAAEDAPVVVCTCSTIGAIAEAVNHALPFVSQRVDHAMADKAVTEGSRLLIVATLQSTLEPTQRLLETSAEARNRSVVIDQLFVDNAWSYFEADDHEGYWRSIAKGIDAGAAGYDVVVLAQASMAGAGQYCSLSGVPLLSSPQLGVAHAVETLHQSAA